MPLVPIDKYHEISGVQTRLKKWSTCFSSKRRTNSRLAKIKSSCFRTQSFQSSFFFQFCSNRRLASIQSLWIPNESMVFSSNYQKSMPVANHHHFSSSPWDLIFNTKRGTRDENHERFIFGYFWIISRISDLVVPISFVAFGVIFVLKKKREGKIQSNSSQLPRISIWIYEITYGARFFDLWVCWTYGAVTAILGFCWACHLLSFHVES